MNNGTQKAKILAALLAGDEISTLEILKRFGCLSASGRISEIRKDVYVVANVGGGVDGTGERKVRYAVYKYIKPEPQQGRLF